MRVCPAPVYLAAGSPGQRVFPVSNGVGRPYGALGPQPAHHTGTGTGTGTGCCCWQLCPSSSPCRSTAPGTLRPPGRTPSSWVAAALGRAHLRTAVQHLREARRRRWGQGQAEAEEAEGVIGVHGWGLGFPPRVVPMACRGLGVLVSRGMRPSSTLAQTAQSLGSSTFQNGGTTSTPLHYCCCCCCCISPAAVSTPLATCWSLLNGMPALPLPLRQAGKGHLLLLIL
jgi:hypothetical protein